MIECHNNINGICTIATYLSEYKATATAHESTCQVCIASEKPRGINKATCGLAVLYLRKAGVFTLEQHRHLVDCGTTVMVKSDSLTNRAGAALTKILATIGVREPVDCDCQAYATSMDSWGWAGCTNRKQEIIDHLNKQTISWLDMLKVAAAGYLTTEALVDDAIRLSKP
jgi:hypothetical protein